MIPAHGVPGKGQGGFLVLEILVILGILGLILPGLISAVLWNFRMLDRLDPVSNTENPGQIEFSQKDGRTFSMAAERSPELEVLPW